MFFVYIVPTADSRANVVLTFMSTASTSTLTAMSIVICQTL